MDENRLYQFGVFNRRRRCDVPKWACTTRYMDNISKMMSYDQTPFLELPAHYMSDIATTGCVILKTPAQIGKTTAIENFLGWICEFDRANTMLVLDTRDSGRNMSKNRIRPFLRDVCGINNPDSSGNKNPDRSNEVCNIGLGRGANLLISSAKSASDLRSTPCKYMLMDELDAWPIELKGEGDPVQLALGRMMRFRGMCVMTSTPTSFEGRIMQQFLSGTRQTWGVWCACGQFLECRWDDIDWSGSIPIIHCKSCGCIYSEDDIKLLNHGYNNPQNNNPYSDEFGRVWRSFEVFGTLCHAFYSWQGLKRNEIRSLSLGDATYQSFRNTILGEVYKPKNEMNVDKIELMRAVYTPYTHDKLPADIAFITMGVDTHETCLYCETVGFSSDLKRVYGIEYKILAGDPHEGDVWESLGLSMNTIYKTEDDRILKTSFAFCDSGGHRTNDVYMYSFRNKRFMPIKGFVTPNPKNPDPLVGRQIKTKLNAGIKAKCLLQFVGVNAGKDALLNMEILTITGEKRMYYPRGNGYDEDYFKGLLIEKRVDGKWIAPYGRSFNEPLDCRVYAMAAAEYYKRKYYDTKLDKELLNMKKDNEQSVDPVQQVALKKEHSEKISEISEKISENTKEKNNESQTKKYRHL